MARTKKQTASLILALFTMVFSLVAIFSIFLPVAKVKSAEDSEILEEFEEMDPSLTSISTIDVAKVFFIQMSGGANMEDMAPEEIGKLILTAILIQGDSTEGIMSFVFLGASILVVLLGFVTALLGLIGAFAKGKTGALVLSILTWVFAIVAFVGVFMMTHGTSSIDPAIQMSDIFSIGLGSILMLASTTAAFGTAVACVATKDKKVKKAD